MLFIGFSLILITCVFSLYGLNFKVNGLNKLVTSIPKQVFEYSVPVSEEELSLYFVQNKVKEKYEEYIEKHIYKYVDKYDVEYFFYNINDKGVCDVNDCQGVEISFKAPINTFYTYRYISYYEIRRMI